MLLALNDDFENRLWEERELGLQERVSNWDLTSSRIAKAKLQILSGGSDLDAAVRQLHSAGVELGRYWRKGSPDDAEVDKLIEAHRSARRTVLDASATIGRKILS